MLIKLPIHIILVIFYSINFFDTFCQLLTYGLAYIFSVDDWLTQIRHTVSRI